MNTNLKTIILNHLNSAEKATIKFTNLGTTHIDIKLPRNTANLGQKTVLIKTEGNIYKHQLNRDLSFNLSNEINLDEKISVLIVEQKDLEQKPIFWGGTNCINSISCEDEVLQNNEKSTENDNTLHAKQPTTLDDDCKMENLSQYNVNNERNIDANCKNTTPYTPNDMDQAGQNANKMCNFTTEQSFAQNDYFENKPYIVKNTDLELKPELFTYTDSEIEQEIDNNFNQVPKCEVGKCANCKYKQVFYQTEKINEAKEVIKEIKKIQNEQTQPQYYTIIQSQYEEMFERYPKFEELSNIIPNSKWIKVDCPTESYVLGLIYDGSEVQYMCYGVPQLERQLPPPELADISQWLPLDVSNPNGEGLWIMYQSAETGETINVNVV